MFPRRTGIGLAVIAVIGCGVLAFAVLREGEAPVKPARGGAAAKATPAPQTVGCRVSLAVPGTAGSGLALVATQVKIDPRTGIVVSCRPVLGNGPLTYDFRYARGNTMLPLIVNGSRAPFGGAPG